MKPSNEYEVRFIDKKDVAELINLWHLSKTAKEKGDKHAKLIWTTTNFCDIHKEYDNTAVYKDLCGLLNL